jgi:hypothetical protein
MGFDPSAFFIEFFVRHLLIKFLDLLQGLEILFDVGPFEALISFLQSAIQLLLNDQCQNTGEDLTPDGLIALMEDAPGSVTRLYSIRLL